MKVFEHPYGTIACLKRLIQEYEKYKNLYVAFDFDNTIFDYHNTGGNFSQVIDLLRDCSELGFKLILFTSNEGDRLTWIIEYCKHFGIKVDYVNENPEIMSTRKPYYNVLLDDRAGLASSFIYLSDTIEYIKKKQNGNG